MPTKVTIEQLAQWLRAQDDVLLLGHVSPDGDAAGSCLGLWHALTAMGKRAAAALPGGMPKQYAMLPGAEQVLDSDGALPFEPRAVLSVDVADLNRLGEGGLARFQACENNACLDHHGTNPGFGRIYAVNGEAAAVGQMALELVAAMGVPLSREMADCLYTAILTDCGQFSHSNTKPDTFRAAAVCAEAGADVSGLARQIYRIRPRARQKLMGLVLAGLETSEDGKMAWARLTEAMLAEAGATWEDNEGIVNGLVDIEGVVFAALAEQRGDAVKFSLRSNAPFDVAADVAKPLGGGGHSRAAGCTLNMGVDEGLEKVLALAREALDRLED